MVHYPESEIEEVVTEWFSERYGEENVERQKYIDTGWRVDVFVDVGFAHLYIEIESRETTVREGIAQAGGYAGTDSKGIPLVIIPPGHIVSERREAFETMGVAIVEFDSEIQEFV